MRAFSAYRRTALPRLCSGAVICAMRPTSAMQGLSSVCRCCLSLPFASVVILACPTCGRCMHRGSSSWSSAVGGAPRT